MNYARYLSAYFAEVTNLPVKNPDVYEAFKAGQYSVQISSCSLFGWIPIDQTNEVTVNKNTQTPGGTTRFSLNSGAIKQHYITAEYRSAFLGLIRSIVQGHKSKLHHLELQQIRIKRDKEAVSTNVNAWLMDASALTCADYQTVIIKLLQY